MLKHLIVFIVRDDYSQKHVIFKIPFLSSLLKGFFFFSFFFPVSSFSRHRVLMLPDLLIMVHYPGSSHVGNSSCFSVSPGKGLDIISN